MSRSFSIAKINGACLFLMLLFSCYHYKAEAAQNLGYDYDSTNGLRLYFGELGTVKFSTDIEAGPVRDGALYASYGLEGQIYHFTKAVFTVVGEFPAAIEDHAWITKFDYAPIYNSIKTTNREKITYQTEDDAVHVNGNNFYLDWYKNLGSRTYYLGNLPVVEAYLGYKTPNHFFKAGRMKGPIGMDDEDVFWQDDAKFGPMSHWLSRDLLSGVSYTLSNNLIEATVALLSGSNPSKGYTNYLGRIESPNLKSNNTPTYATKIKLNYGEFLPANYEGYIYFSHMLNITGSTWDDRIKDGKRNASTGAHGGLLKYKFDDNWLMSSAKIFGQYTVFISGLKTDSDQNDNSDKYKEIRQQGFYIGGELGFFADKLQLGAAYENFDRYDFNLFERFNFAKDNPYKGSKQHSKILNIRYNINDAISVGAAYHIVKNPALHASDILKSRSTDKVKITINVNL